jgi:hypothetical protein
MEEKTLPELFLLKLEKLTPREREVLIKTIEWMNTPIFVDKDMGHGN